MNLEGILLSIRTCHHFSFKVKFNVVELQNEPNQLCVRSDGRIGFVGIEQGKLKCLTCRYDTNKCCHVNLLRQVTSDGASDIPDAAFELVSKEKEWEPTVFTLLKPVSSEKISYQLSSELGSKLSAGYIFSISYFHHPIIGSSSIQQYL